MTIGTILFDRWGLLRSGWRFAIFVAAFTLAAIIISMLGAAVYSIIYSATGTAGELPTPVARILQGLPLLAAALIIGWLCTKFLEKLPPRALGASFTPGWLSHLMLGIVFGGGSLLLAILIAFVFGGLRFEVNSDLTRLTASLAGSFLVLAVAAAFEEALCRGYILQTFARSNLAWLAIALTSALFAAGHLYNPDAGPFSMVNTALAGVWLGIAYLRSRDLWFPFGMHLMWNWMQGSIFGIEISGITDLVGSSVLKEVDSGPAWLTGETYGIEGGVAGTIAIIVSIAAIMLLPIFRPSAEMAALTSPRRSDGLDLEGNIDGTG
ncbi:MAG: type II CAAX endopeptidase family protein [Acidobacteriota bacterium]